MAWDRWAPRRKIEEDYGSALQKLSKEMNAALYGASTLTEMERVLAAIAKSPSFWAYAKAAALRMCTGLFKDNARTWRAAARQAMRGAEIHQALKEELFGPVGQFYWQKIEDNAHFITRMPLELAHEITKLAARRTVEGIPQAAIMAEIQARFPDMTAARAKLIARTEVGKTNTALTEARSRELGVRWYTWRTAEDGRVRSAHKHMEGVLVSFADPPSPELLVGLPSAGFYHAGDIYNCRCYPEPVVDIRFLKFPVKVYRQGAIQRMTKEQFLQIA